MLQIAVCDDDTNFLKNFEPLLHQFFNEAQQAFVLTTFNNGRTLVDVVEKQGRFFDVIFLDVDMPVIDGFQTADRLCQLGIRSILVFITYIESQVREGYKYEAYRYIFKSNLKAELKEAVTSIISKLRIRATDDEIMSFKYRNADIIDVVEVKKGDILYFRIDKARQVTLKTIHSDYKILRKPFAVYQKMLNSDSFCLHMRHYLLNFNHIVDFDRNFFTMENGEKIPLGVSKETRRAAKEKYMMFLEERL